MKIPYYVKNVYGIDRLYVAEEEVAKTVSGLVKMRTLDPDDKARFEALGIEFEQVLPPNTQK